ncbi:BRO family protein, partial [Arthrospira platensis SPKY1]|nr:BRO family protein [Arthrospira platensis SPKY1]
MAKDVAEVLGYARPRNAISTHCKGALNQGIPTNSGVQSMSIIPERDVYRLIMRSKLPAAEQFEEWVVGTVLPSVRKHGGYIANQEAMTPEQIMANGLKAAESIIAEKQQQIEAQQAQIVKFKPKADALDR